MERFKKNLILLLNAVLVLAAFLFIYAMIGTAPEGEAYIGEFDIKVLESRWQLDGDEIVRFPCEVSAEEGQTLTFKSALPADIRDGMRMLFRSSMQDIVVYIDGKERQSYTSSGFDYMSEHLPSAYLAVDLSENDRNKEITLKITTKSTGICTINDVIYSYGNNVWFPVIRMNLPVIAAAVIMIIAGLIVLMVCLVIRRQILESVRAVIYLSECIIVVGMWIISESGLRQIIFHIPSLSAVFTYLLIEIIGAFVALYFNEVQNRRYEKAYVVVITAVTAQLVINFILQVSGIMDFYQSLICSHIWMGLGILVAFTAIIIDILRHRIGSYVITAVGMLMLLASCGLELISFFTLRFYMFGMYMSIGFLLMMTMTIAQTVRNETGARKARVERQQRLTEQTIETIALAIDAKDEHTGGHSQRVAYYAKTLAIQMKDVFNLKDKDIERIYNAGLMHDIGKIAVPDSMLNKEERLTRTENELIKQHTVLGEKMLINLPGFEDLADTVRHHHERFDGRGYPDGLIGEEISIASRILYIAESFDVMTMGAPYKKKKPFEEAVEEIKHGAGSLFDPVLAEKFTEMVMSGEIDEESRQKSVLDRLPDEVDETEEREYLPGIRMLSYMEKIFEKEDNRFDIYRLSLGSSTGDEDEFALKEARELLEDIIHDLPQPPDFAVPFSNDSILMMISNRSRSDHESIFIEIEEAFRTRDRRYKFEIRKERLT